MEIERKYLLDQLPENLTSYPCKKIEQGYLSTEPVVRIRRSDDEYYLTYKSKGLMVREEYNLPLTEESYLHLREKADGVLISKTRYLLPLTGTDLTIELDVEYGTVWHSGRTSNGSRPVFGSSSCFSNASVWKRSKENFAQAAQRLSGVPAGIRKSFPCRKRNYLKRHAKRPI